jgi:hypothetical protein
VTAQLLPIEAATYEASALHGADRVWQETNCYIDLWIEVLHALGLDPVPALATTLAMDFQGDQWEFFKVPAEDLRDLYGINVAEMNVWQPLHRHVEEQLRLGRLTTVEVDAWNLPDTAGVSYQLEHVKTTIAVNLIDLEARKLGYFHNQGYYEVMGDDVTALFHLDGRDPRILLPYVELVRLEEGRIPDDVVTERGTALAAAHLRRAPADNPLRRFRKRFEHDLPWLRDEGMATFHLYAFATLRQLGASAEIAADVLDWLTARGFEAPATAPDDLRSIATTAKALQFKLARYVAGRAVELGPMLDEMEGAWDRSIGVMASRHAG